MKNSKLMNLFTTQIAFIDANVPDIQTLINGILPNIEVFVLHPHEDGVKQITQRLATYQNIQAIHLISHGSPGQLYLGNGVLSHENLHQYADSLQQWRNALRADAEILLYGCKVAGDPHPPVILSKTKNPNVILFAQRRQRRNATKNLPSNFIHRLSQLTGAKIAASTTNIGHATKGGNWQLDCCTSSINTPIALTPTAINAYTEVLNSEFAWVKQFGGTGNNPSESITVDSFGNVYTTGSFTDTVDFDPGPTTFNLTPVGGIETFICKVDANGNFIWVKQFGGIDSFDVDSYGITVDSLGNVHTTGRFYGTTDFDPGLSNFNLTSDGFFNSFISKLDSNGNFIWAKQFSNLENISEGSSESIKVDTAGNVYTTGGFSYGPVDFDPGPGIFNLTNSGIFDSFISKLDADGNFLWAKQLASSFGTSITLDSASNVYTTGRFSGPVDFDPGPGIFNLTSADPSTNDGFISKLDTNGNFLWARRFGDIEENDSKSITVDDAGNSYITGIFSGTIDFDPVPSVGELTALGVNDSFICKLDANGNFLWAKQLGSPNSYVNSYSITLDNEGNIYTTGDFVGTVTFDPNITAFISAGVSDGFVYKLDADGNFLWAKQFGGTDTIGEGGNEVTIDKTNSVYVTGYFEGTADFDPSLETLGDTLTSASAGNFDAFVLKLGSPEIEVLDGVTNILDGSTIPLDFGTTAFGTPLRKTFTINNTGTAFLNLSSFTIPTAGFSFTPPSATSIAPANTTSFDVQLDASALGTYTGTLQFVTNDEDENPFNFTITGTVVSQLQLTAGTLPSEAGIPGTLNLTLNAAPLTDLVVNFNTLGSTTTNLADYTFTAGTNITAVTENSLTIAAGQTTATLNVMPVNDAIIDPNETVTLNLDAGAGYVVDAVNNNAILTIEDNDIEYALTADTPVITEGNSGTQTINFTIARTGRIDVSSSVDFNLAGAAINPDDYTFAVTGTGISTTNNTITFAPNATTANITLNIAGDSVVEPNETVEFSLSNPIASAGFSATIPGVTSTTTTINNDDSADVIITPLSLNLIEGGTTGSFTVRLNSSPVAPVIVNFNASTQINPLTSLTFDATNWNLPQTVNVSAIDDTLIEGLHTEQIISNISSNDLNYNGFFVNPVAVNITDNDTEPPVNNAGILIQQTEGSTNVTEGGIVDTYQISLTGQPTANVTLNLTSDNQITPIPAITFTPTNWNLPQTITVTAIDDLNQEGTHTSLIRHTAISSDANYNGKSQDVDVTITDNDTLPAGIPGINLIRPIDRLDVQESYGSDLYKIKLNSKPIADVILTIQADGQTTTDLQTLTFMPANWNLAQSVTIKAVDDKVLEGFQTSIINHSVSSLDPNYQNIVVSNLSVNVNDNDNLGLVKAFAQSESGAGTAQDDFLTGSLQPDILYGRAGNNYLNGNAGDDILFGGDNSDGMLGSDGNDQLLSGAGDDYIEGNVGDDIICAGAGSDRLHGGNGNDFLVGDAGNDRLIGDAGVDTLIGGAGKDAFVIGVKTGGDTINQADLITDFTDNQDVIDLINSLTFAQLKITQGKGEFVSDTVIQNLSTGEYFAILKNVLIGNITEADFV
jgi:hypothetical protein